LGETDRTSGGIETGFSAFPKELILGLAGIALLGTIGNIYLE
jgi:predicted benzoate:H+ symporter BenE